MHFKIILFTVFLFCSSLSMGQKEADTSYNWFISANLASFFRDERTFYPQSQRFITTNRYISIEPELSLNNYFSIKFPIAIGLNRIKEGYIQENNRNSFYYYYNNAPDSLSFYKPYFLPYYTTFNGWDHNPHEKYYMRNQDLVVQFGINPKIYFWGQRTVSMYLSQ